MPNRKTRVAIVDDDHDILYAIQLVLEDSGYQTKALTKFNKQEILEWKPDVLILDVLLSGKDGRVICKELKTEQETKCIPIIMISAHPTANRDTTKAGADGFIAKPFKISTLLEKVEGVVNQDSLISHRNSN